MDWFANIGQIIQILLALAALIVAGKKEFSGMRENSFFSAGAILFYLLIALVLVSLWLPFRGKNEIGSYSQLQLSPLPGYDRLIPARSSREGEEEGYKRASHVWAASITGHYFTLLPPESRAKIDRVIFVDPSSESMTILAKIQGERGKYFPEYVKQAVDLCKSEKIEVRLSNHPVLNVVLFDPGTGHAWARVQEFVPYSLGEESALVYAIRKEEWKDRYEAIEKSFKQTWENGRDPNK